MARTPGTLLIATILLSLVSGVSGCFRKADDGLECGDQRETLETKQSRIVNGAASWDPTVVPLTAGSALAVGALMMDYGSGWEPMCTGTVVSPTVVLTAAHCVTDWRGQTERPADMRFSIGRDTEAPRATLAPSQILADPLYDPGGYSAEHDQAVFLFTSPITDTVPELVPLPINRQAMNPAVVLGEDLQTTGFGCIDSNCNYFNFELWWSVEEFVELGSFDMIVDGHGLAGVCFGDSGGPALRNFPGEGVKVIGTLSWGDPDCGNQDHFTLTDAQGAFLDPLFPGCGSVTAQGSCNGNTATYCSSETVVTTSCTSLGQECRADSSGNFRCLDPIGTGCGNVTTQGSCNGSTVTYCSNDTVVTTDCAALSQECRADAAGNFGCQAPIVTGCGAVTPQGSCNGSTVTYCSNDTVVTTDCAPTAEVCAVNGSGSFRCVDPCAGETLMGRCDGDDAIWCENGTVKVRRCADCEQACGFSEAQQLTTCL